MGRRVPRSYNFALEVLDPVEHHARNALTLNLRPWQRFRYAINSGTDTTKMRWSHGAHPNADVQAAYLDLGKSTHEVISSLAFLRMSLDEALTATAIDFERRVKEFYFHGECLLDNMAKVIFIVAHPSSPTKDRGKTKIRLRHWMGWRGLVPEESNLASRSYRFWLTSPRIDQIITIRNSLAHSWQPPFRVNTGTHQVFWPQGIRTRRDFPWPHDPTEIPRLNRMFRKWVPVVDMMRDDLQFLERMQSSVFHSLKTDFVGFETRNHFQVTN